MPASGTATLVPLSEDPCASRRLPAGDQPAPSSHSASVPRRSPAASGARKRSRCSAVPAAASSSPAQALEWKGEGASA